MYHIPKCCLASSFTSNSLPNEAEKRVIILFLCFYWTGSRELVQFCRNATNFKFLQGFRAYSVDVSNMEYFCSKTYFLGLSCTGDSSTWRISVVMTVFASVWAYNSVRTQWESVKTEYATKNTLAESWGTSISTGKQLSKNFPEKVCQKWGYEY